MSTARFLVQGQINGKAVSFFTPPHAEPDFPWVDVEELASAFLDANGAARMVRHSHAFDRDHRPVTTVRNGSRIATIIPHALAQGLCGAIDQWNGFVATEEDESGPAFWAYCAAAGAISVDHWPLSFEQMIHAFHNPGGPFFRS